MENSGSETPQPEGEATKPLISLGDLANLSFGTAWSSSPGSSGGSSRPRERDDRGPRREGGDRPRSENRGPRPERRFNDGPRRESGPRPAGADDRAPRAFQGDRPHRPQGDRPQGDRGPRPQGDRPQGERGPRRDFGSREQRDFRDQRGHREAPPEPIRLPGLDIFIYPEDAPFNKMVQWIKDSHRTFELFELSRAILDKPERFVIVIQPAQNDPRAPEKLFFSLPDRLPFLSEEEAVTHASTANLKEFFNVEDVTVDPPKGSFPVINKCGLTGALLGPPNYHRYGQIVRDHLAQKLPGTSRDYFDRKVETVRDEAVSKQWLESMTKVTRYVLKNVPEGSEPVVFESPESARHHLTVHHRAALVQAVNHLRFPGSQIPQLPENSLIRRAVTDYRDRQLHFPLDTANHLRGRLRRAQFCIYKRGSKGTTLVCGIKRKLRTPGQSFNDSINSLIAFLEKNEGCKNEHLLTQYLQIPEPVPGPDGAKGEIPDADKARAAACLRDLHWLIAEGYVVQFSDGRLLCPAPLAQNAPKSAEHDVVEDHGDEPLSEGEHSLEGDLEG